jgi:hypothetical protein
MVKKLYVNGCSWTDGYTLEYSGLIKKFNLKGKGKDYGYPKIVADYFNLELIDESRYGGSLNRIIRMTWDYLMNNSNRIAETMFIFEIPNGFRDEIYSNKIGKYFNITSGNLYNENDFTEDSNDWYEIKKDVIKNYYDFCNFDEFFKKEHINFMSLIDYIKKYTNNFYIIHYNVIKNKLPSELFKIDNVNLIKIKDKSFKNKSEYEEISDMSELENLSIEDEMNNGIKDTHMGISGHKKMAEIICSQITIKYKLI